MRQVLRSSVVLMLSLVLVSVAHAQQPSTSSTIEAELRRAVRSYDEALRRADARAVEQFFAQEYFFVNPRGQRVTRAERLANLREGRTQLDTVVHAPAEETFQAYGNDLVVYTARLTLVGRYGGQAQQGQARALVVWVRRDGRWQQAASQLTPILP